MKKKKKKRKKQKFIRNRTSVIFISVSTGVYRKVIAAIRITILLFQLYDKHFSSCLHVLTQNYFYVFDLYVSRCLHLFFSSPAYSFTISQLYIICI